MELKEKVIIALDLEDKAQIHSVVDALLPQKVKFKIGSIAFTRFGPEFVREIIGKKADVFLDLKLYDIPNTMKRTAAAIAQMKCWAFTVHLQAGVEALQAVRAEVDKTGFRPLILGVTVLTSSALKMDEREIEVDRLVKIAAAAKLDGVIASSLDVRKIKQMGNSLKVITPGIRSPEHETGDQKRITTARKAFENGADYIVVGRPILQAEDYCQALKKVLES